MCAELNWRHQALLYLVAQGYQVKEISKILHISQAGARSALARLFKRFGARNSAHLVAEAIRAGVLPANLIMPNTKAMEPQKEMDVTKMLPEGTMVIVTPFSAVRGPAYRARIVGYNKDRTRYHVGAEREPGSYSLGGSWASPGEVKVAQPTDGEAS